MKPFIIFLNLMLILQSSICEDLSDIDAVLGIEDASAKDNLSGVNSIAEGTEELITVLKMQPVGISPDGLLDFVGLAKKYISNVEEHDVVTDDGYILKVFHIPGDKTKAVLLSHGILCTSDDFILRGNTSLIHMLFRKGYDIWVINFRGNRYSRKHKTLDPNMDQEFWQFSMQELGYYDLPAVIDFILNKTGESKLSLVGHSEGTSVLFILASTRPEYNEKIKIFIALAPVAYLDHSGVAIRTSIRVGPLLIGLLESLAIEEVVGYYSVTKLLIDVLCSQGALGYAICYKFIVGSLLGYNPENLDQNFFQTVLGHFPAGTSRKNFEHYVQVGNSGIFRQFDNGMLNYKHYGSIEPPRYNLLRVTCNVALFASYNDLIVGIQDAKRIKNELPKANITIIDNKKFNHIDFLYGNSSYKELYPKVLAVLDTYNL